ncbi:MAG: hypothetical protein JO198_11145 [Candidatus Dormibacteraeota bacterium]|nr:hypothetical protein [Candidatus Dormibacteraeota bacterium]
MCYLQQQFSSDASSIVAADRATHATYATYDGPYDPSAAGYTSCVPGPLAPIDFERTWVNAIHAAGLHAWFRQTWNTWKGLYGERVLTYSTSPQIPYETSGGVNAVLSGVDSNSYLARTYRFIIGHPELFANGDIFTPQSEPDGAGIGCSKCQFPSTSEYNRFLRDSMAVDRMAFADLGRNVTVGMWGVSCTQLILDSTTVSQMGVVSTDCYMRSAAQLASALAGIHATYGVPVAVGEWGDIWDQAQQPALNNELNAVMSVLSSAPYVVGVNYWQAIGGPGGEGLVDPANLQLNSAGGAVGAWYSGWPAR